MFSFRILFDYHRTTADIGYPIQHLARRLYGVRVPISKVCRRLIVGHYLSDSQYERILQIVIENSGYAKRYIHEVDGALRTIRACKDDGHRPEIVTASQYEGHISILEWLRFRHSSVTTRSVGRRTMKSTIAKDYDIAIEDSPEQAESLAANGTPFVYLLDRPTNQDQETPPNVTRIPSHAYFLEEVRKLAQRLFPQQR